MDKSMRSFISRFMIMFCTFAVGICRLIYTNVFLGIKTTTTEFKMPFTEEKSDIEFTLNFLIQTVLIAYGLFGYIGMESAMEVAVVCVNTASQAIKYEFQKLDANIALRRFNDVQERLTFRNIVQQIMDADRYLQGFMF